MITSQPKSGLASGQAGPDPSFSLADLGLLHNLDSSIFPFQNFPDSLFVRFHTHTSVYVIVFLLMAQKPICIYNIRVFAKTPGPCQETWGGRVERWVRLLYSGPLPVVPLFLSIVPFQPYPLSLGLVGYSPHYTPCVPLPRFFCFWGVFSWELPIHVH